MSDACLIVAPHPDDETIGAGIWMARNRNRAIVLLHLTDGSPRDPTTARMAGFESRASYAALRLRELNEAIRLVGLPESKLIGFHYVDQETHLHLPELVTRLTFLINELRPSLVLCPAYEGGHPDHDSAACAVAATRLRVQLPFQHREFPLYHAGPDGSMVTGEFLPGANGALDVCILSAAEQDQKRAMLATFRSQQHMLRHFSVVKECFRDAPSYDFGCPPHGGTLLYEHWGFGVSGRDWRRNATELLVHHG